jgi:glycosyltransferase involved in cell wall biosynthesis
MRARLTGGHPESPLLVYVGRLSAEKNIERLKPILEALPGTSLALVGDGPHRKALAEHFAGLPVHMPGFLRGEELAAAYASADLFVMPSRTETLGLVVLEAMSSGLPVVGARAGGIPEMIVDGVTGTLFDTESQAVEAIRCYVQCAVKRRSTGAAAREHAVEHSWRQATLTLLEHYKTACALQNVAPDTAPRAAGVGRLVGRATMYALRKLLP